LPTIVSIARSVLEASSGANLWAYCQRVAREVAPRRSRRSSRSSLATMPSISNGSSRRRRSIRVIPETRVEPVHDARVAGVGQPTAQRGRHLGLRRSARSALFASARARSARSPRMELERIARNLAGSLRLRAPATVLRGFAGLEAGFDVD
jgi:hypothetical protein